MEGGGGEGKGRGDRVHEGALGSSASSGAGDAGAWRRSKGARGRDEMRARVRRGLGGLDCGWA